MYDSFRPLEGDCDLKLLTFNDIEGKMVFWHSSAHILGESMEREYGVYLCHGPPTSEGFFYDSYCGHHVILENLDKIGFWWRQLQTNRRWSKESN